MAPRDRSRSHIRRRAGITALGVVAGTLALAPPALAAPAGCAAAPAPEKRTIAYVTRSGVARDLTSLDLSVPARACLAGGPGRAPVVLWVHGGGYRRGDKRQQIADKVRLFTRRGYLFASVNYRLTTDGPRSARHPDHFRDVAAAVAWARSNARRFGGDGTRVALLGHSAGADIVSNVSVDPTWLRERGLSLRALRCSGPFDTEGFDKVASTGDADKAMWQTALGNLPGYERRTSATLIARSRTGIPRTITVVRGSARRQAIERAFAARLRAVGTPVTVIEAPSLSHADVSRRIGAPGDQVMTPPLMRFLRSCLGR